MYKENKKNYEDKDVEVLDSNWQKQTAQYTALKIEEGAV